MKSPTARAALLNSSARLCISVVLCTCVSVFVCFSFLMWDEGCQYCCAYILSPRMLSLNSVVET